MIDTHAHLDALDDADEAIDRARAAGVGRILTIGGRQALAIADSHAEVYAVVGIHPHETGEVDDGAVMEVRRLIGSPKAVAIGEIGLDFHRDYAPRDAQRRLFAEQLELASELAAPVVIHTRAADEETAGLLAGFGGTVVMHCFSTPDLLPIALERGYYVSFAGNVTYPKADDLRAAAARVPANRILAETDSPYLAPQPVRGKRNEPAYVVHTVAALAEARGEDRDELAQRIDENARRAFSLP